MYSVIDIESNGAGFRQESIIDIAIYRYDGHEITDQFISLVNPESNITPFVQKLTGISPKMVTTAPKFHEIAKRVVEITAGTTLVGHNIDFDYRMLRQSFQRLGYDFKTTTIDTIPLAKKLIPEAESYSLGKLVKSLGIPLTDQHRAAGDARATLELFKILMDKDKDLEILQQHKEEKHAKTYLNKVRDLTQDLPAEKGILYLQNSKGTIVYSEFSADINRCAKKIFNSRAKKFALIQQQTEQARYETVGSGIVAKLILKAKGLRQNELLNFGLYHQNGIFSVEKIRGKGAPLLKFRSFTQGMKAVAFIKNNPQTGSLENLENIINRKAGDEIWVTDGRTAGEKTFLLFENGVLRSFGFFTLHTQIQTRQKINHLKTDISGEIAGLENDIKLGLLKGDFSFFPIPAE